MKTVYRAKYVLPISADVIENGEVLVEGGRIREVGRGVAARHPDAAVEDLGRAALLPGFVNAHSHVEYTLSRNRYDGLNLWDWISRVGYRRDMAPAREVMLASARLGAAQCLCSGITCLGDCSFSGIAAEAMDEIGLRGIVYREIFGQSMGDEYPDKCAMAVAEIARLQSRASHRLTIGISPHTVYTSNSAVLELCGEAAELGMPVALHLSETWAEAEYTVKGTGPLADWRREIGYEPMVSGLRPARVLEEAGLLREGVSLAHCVHLTEDEIELIASSGASVVHCPRSNARLGAGVAPISQFRRAGAVIGLGTDSSASCGELDFFDEMRFALALHRAIAEDASAISAKGVLDMATAGGAAALGMSDVGRLEPGMRADMIAVDVSGMLGGEDVHLAVLSRSPADVTLVMVDGESVEFDVEARHAEFIGMMEHQSIG